MAKVRYLGEYQDDSVWIEMIVPGGMVPGVQLTATGPNIRAALSDLIEALEFIGLAPPKLGA